MTLTDAFSDFSEVIETEEDQEVLMATLDGLVGKCLKAINPKLTDQEIEEITQHGAGLPTMTLAANEANWIASHIYTALKFAQGAPEPEDGASAHELMSMSWANRTEHKPMEKEKLLKELPWMLKIALDFILSDNTYKKDPRTGSAVVARTIACLLNTLECVPDLNQEAPENIPVAGLVN